MENLVQKQQQLEGELVAYLSFISLCLLHFQSQPSLANLKFCKYCFYSQIFITGTVCIKWVSRQCLIAQICKGMKLKRKKPNWILMNLVCYPSVYMCSSNIPLLLRKLSKAPVRTPGVQVENTSSLSPACRKRRLKGRRYIAIVADTA